MHPSSSPSAGNVSISQLYRAYIVYIARVDFLSKSTVDNRGYSLGRFCEYLTCHGIGGISEINLPLIYAYLASLEGRSPGTLNHEKQAIKSFFRYCQVVEGVELAFDPELIHRHRVPATHIHILTVEDIRRVICHCAEKPVWRQDALAIALMFETGLRLGEVVTLAGEHMNGPEIRIIGKGGKARVVFIPEDLYHSLREFMASQERWYGCIFRPIQRNGECFTRDGLRRRIQTRFRECGIEMHPHELRHAFAVQWLQRGGDLRTLQRLMGHASLDTTMRYLNLTDSHTHDEYKQLFGSSVIQSHT